MAAKAKLKRKSYFVDERALNRAKKALGVKTEAEVIRLSVERVAEMEGFWEFMKKHAGHSDGERGEILRWPWPFWIPVSISIIGNAAYIKRVWRVSGELI